MTLWECHPGLKRPFSTEQYMHEPRHILQREAIASIFKFVYTFPLDMINIFISVQIIMYLNDSYPLVSTSLKYPPVLEVII